MKTLYFPINYVVMTHNAIIRTSGGMPGVKDKGRIESILEHIQNDDYYPNFLDKLAHLCFSINKDHAFNDGNKRTSLALGAFFLTLNGYDHCIKIYYDEMENYTLWVAQGLICKDLLRDLLEDITLLEQRDEVRIALLEAIEAAT
uniref:type II toxin-antitoxin system death-on-curing family toxin n=1 Tax=Maridesulfovibrio frigidus TaxID=340956 RepID=UPI0004E22BA9|nr:type II toxin-antitoxin system death-on-curing family toxin [Maridesulfovibrio frigidus]